MRSSLRYLRRRNFAERYFMLGNRLDPEGAKSMKKGRCGNISEPQSTSLLMAALRWCARAWSSEQTHIFWHLAMSFLDVCCSPPFQKRGIVFPVRVNAIIQEVDAQKSFSVPEHCHHHLACWLHNFFFLGDRNAGRFHWCDSLLLSGTKWGTCVSSRGENRVSKSSGTFQNTTRRLRTNLPLFWIWHLSIRLQVHTEHIDIQKRIASAGASYICTSAVTFQTDIEVHPLPDDPLLPRFLQTLLLVDDCCGGQLQCSVDQFWRAQ